MTNWTHVARRRTYVLVLMAEGFNLREIAIALGITYRTAQHDQRVLSKRFGAKTSAHLIAIAFRKRLLLHDTDGIAASGELDREIEVVRLPAHLRDCCNDIARADRPLRQFES